MKYLRFRRVYRSDDNARTLDKIFEAHGATLWGGERPVDRWVGFAGITAPVEYKNPETSYGRKGLTDGQSEFARTWRGGETYLVSTVEDVRRVVAEMRLRGRLLNAAMPVRSTAPPGPSET